MHIISIILILIISLLHIYFLILEVFLWDKPKGLKTFGLKQDFATESKVLAKNQGLYNGFLSAGLIWAILHNNTGFGIQIAMFFLTCVLVAGIYGAYTTQKIRLFYIQGVPALLGLVSLFFL